MGNQAENAFKAAGIEAGENLANNVIEALDTIEAKLNEVDESVTISDNDNTSAESAEPEKPNASEIEEMRKTLDEQNATIEKLVGIMGTMVTKYGAQQSDNSGENVNTNAFPISAPTAEQSENIPLLNEIKLG